MNGFARAVVSARLTFKMLRFEILAMTTASLLVAAAALWVKAQLDATGATQACLEQWLVLAEDSSPACVAPVMRWDAIVYGDAGRVMGAMLVAPFAVGIVLGVPMVGREIEQRTAATAWALAGSRWRWLLGRAWPIVLLVIALGVIMGVSSTVLAEARTGQGLEGSTYGDVLFFGPAVFVHLLVGLGIGLVAGAVVGRTLPALIVGAAAAFVAVVFLYGSQSATGPASPYATTTVGGSTEIGQSNVLDPNWDFYFLSVDGRVLTKAEVLAAVPTGTTDIAGWIHSNYKVLTEQISGAVTARFQTTEAIGVLVAASVLLLIAIPIVERRRPG